MSYQQTEKPRGFLYHYTTRDHLEDILRDGRIRLLAPMYYIGSIGPLHGALHNMMVSLRLKDD